MHVMRPECLIALWSKIIMWNALKWRCEVKAKSEHYVSSDTQTSVSYKHEKMETVADE